MTLESQYKRFLSENPDSKITFIEWIKSTDRPFNNIPKDFEPTVSDDFMIGPDGAYEHQDNEITWDNILDEIEINLHAEIPIRVKNWLKNTFESPKFKK